MARVVVGVAWLLCWLGAAAADSRVIRIATVAPEGTAWARELSAFARDVENQTQARVRIKVYFGGIAGGEMETFERIKRGHLDGAISGGMLCSHLAPTLRVLRILGLVRDGREATYLINRLRPAISREFEANGYVDLGVALVGMDLLFSRQPVRTLDDLRRAGSGTSTTWSRSS